LTDHSRIMLAIGGLVLGLALGTVGTWLLGTARAVAKHAGSDRRRRADLGQYAAALAALAGFLLTAGGSGVLVSELLPFSGPVRLVSAAITGVLVFAVAGVGFSRVADMSEEARVRRMPPPRYTPSPAAAPSPAPILTQREAETSATVEPSTSAVSGVHEPATSEIGTSETSDEVASTGGVDITGDVAPSPAVAAGADGAPDRGESDAEAIGPPTPPEVSDESIVDAEALLRLVRPGWIYRDSRDHWYLGVGGESGHAQPLLQLPEFTLVEAAEPAYPLVVAGAGEIAVVPLHATADEHETSVR
jgi:hypothetical protein